MFKLAIFVKPWLGELSWSIGGLPAWAARFTISNNPDDLPCLCILPISQAINTCFITAMKILIDPMKKGLVPVLRGQFT